MFVTVLLIGFSSCSKTPKSVSLLHEDAVLIARIDVKQLAEKSEFQNDKDLKGGLDNILEAMPKEVREKVKEVLDDPVKLGLDLRDPIFVSVAPVKGRLGDDDMMQGPGFRIVGTVYDDDNFREFLDVLSKSGDLPKVKDSDGLQVMNFGDFVLAFNDDVFVISDISASGKKSADKVLRDIFDGDSKLAENKDVQEMCSRDGVAQFLLIGESMAKLDTGYGRGIENRLRNLSILSDLEMNTGELLWTTSLLFKDDAARKRFEEYAAIAGDIQGDYAEYFSKSNLALFSNIDGGKLYDMLDKMDILRAMTGGDKDEMSEIADIVKSVKGDIAFGINEADFRHYNGSGALYVSASSDKLFQLIASNQGGDGSGSDETNLDMGDGARGILGYKKGTMYGTLCVDKSGNPKRVAPFEKPSKAFSKSDIVGKGTGFYAFLNFKLFDTVLDILPSKDEIVLQNICTYFEYAEAYYHKDIKFVMRMVAKDKERNAMAVVVDVIKSIISDITSQNEDYYSDDDNMFLESSDPDRSGLYDDLDDDMAGYDDLDREEVMELEELMKD